MEYFGLESLLHQIETDSLSAADAWETPISFLYIDAHHGRAHAYADLLVWEPFVIPGGTIALDDTVGFFPGCVAQTVVAVSSGALERLGETGGITFLRKRQPLIPGIQHFPPSREIMTILVAEVSAWCGAMDPALRFPLGPQEEVSADDRRRRCDNLIQRLTSFDHAAANLEGWPCVRDYLLAVVHYQMDDLARARELLESLCSCVESARFPHYDLSILEFSQLRLGQISDLIGERSTAIHLYRQVERSTEVPEVAEVSRQLLSKPFSRETPTNRYLLREYVISSPFHKYRTY